MIGPKLGLEKKKSNDEYKKKLTELRNKVSTLRTTRNKLLESVAKERAERLNKRKEKYEAYTKKSEEIKLWTLRELLIFLEGRDPKKSATVSNIVNDIVRGKYNDEG